MAQRVAGRKAARWCWAFARGRVRGGSAGPARGVQGSDHVGASGRVDQFFEMEVEGTRLFFRLGKEAQYREGDNTALGVNLNRLHLFDKQTTQSLVWN